MNVKEVVIKSKFLLLAMNAYQNMDGEQYSGKFSTVYYSQFATRPLNSNEMSAVLPTKKAAGIRLQLCLHSELIMLDVL